MILFSQWRNLSLATRIKIADQFGFKKVRSTHVSNNEIVDDGFNIKEIEAALEVHNLQNYLDTAETDMGILWGWMVDKIEGREVNIPMKDIKTEFELTNRDGSAYTGDVVIPGLGMRKVEKPKKNAKTKKSKQK